MSGMKSSSLQEICEAIGRASRWLVAAHYSPDPDAYGASCGLALALRQAGKEAACLNESGALSIYSFIPGIDSVQQQVPPGQWDGVIACDCGELNRLGDQLHLELAQVGVMINIDHHISNTFFGRYNYVRSDASSTSELIYEVLTAMGLPVSKEVAACLMTGIMGAHTFAVAEKLVRAGAVPYKIGRALYGDRRAAAVKLQAEALRHIAMHCEGRVSEVVVTAEMLAEFQATTEDCDNLVEAARDIAGVLISISIRRDNDIWKISLRSKDSRYNVSEVAAEFGGGGHREAAAFRWRGSLEELRTRLLARAAKALGGAES
jgi:bifunctional oligoribonuclease and PAP phosphatase NrnA